nr:hypothetical protein [Tanacetum cinerariifolium]
MISNEFAVKFCLEHEVKCENKVVKKELIVASRGEIYFVKFIINLDEDDVEPGVFEEEEKIGEECELLLDDLDFGNISDIEGFNGPQFVCKMGKSCRNKRKQLEKHQLIYSDIGPSMSTETPLTQKEVEREALAISICERYSIVEEERPVIQTMAYSEKYKKILDENCLDRRKLDGVNKEDEEAITKIKREALIEKDDPRAFVILIRLKGKINLNALSDTGLDVNVMPYYIYKELGREEKVTNPFRKICVWKKVSFFGSLPVALQHVEWKPDYTGCFNKKEDSDGQWHAEIKLTDPYENIYDQGFVTKKTTRKLAKYHKLSDIMSPNGFITGTPVQCLE